MHNQSNNIYNVKTICGFNEDNYWIGSVVFEIIPNKDFIIGVDWTKALYANFYYAPFIEVYLFAWTEYSQYRACLWVDFWA